MANRYKGFAPDCGNNRLDLVDDGGGHGERPFATGRRAGLVPAALLILSLGATHAIAQEPDRDRDRLRDQNITRTDDGALRSRDRMMDQSRLRAEVGETARLNDLSRRQLEEQMRVQTRAQSQARTQTRTQEDPTEQAGPVRSPSVPMGRGSAGGGPGAGGPGGGGGRPR